jgi:hypothetical protein
LPVKIYTKTDHGEQDHTLLRTNQPLEEELASLQECPTVTVFNNGDTLASSIELGILTPRNEDCAEIERQDGYCRISGEVSMYLPGESGGPWPNFQPYPSSYITPSYE